MAEAQTATTPSTGDRLEQTAEVFDALLNPQPDGPSDEKADPVETAEGQADEQPETDETEEVEASETDDDPDAEQEAGDEADEEPESDALYDVTVNGETQKVNLDELRRGYQRDADYRQKTAALSDDQRKFDDLVQRSQQEWTRRLQEAETLLSNTEELFGIKAPDWGALQQKVANGEIDQSDYLFQREQWRVYQEQIEANKAKLQESRQQQAQEQEKRWKEYIAENNRRIGEMWPELMDPAKGESIRRDMASALQDYGFSPQEMHGLVDSRQVAILRDAMAYRKLQKGKPEVTKKATKAPKMGKPGVARDARDSKAEKLRASVNRARKNRSIDTVTDAWEAILGS